MKQTEFEEKLRELKNQKRDALRPVVDMMQDNKRKGVAVHEQIDELGAKARCLKTERTMLHKMLCDIEKKYDDKIRQLYDENPVTTRQLEEVSDYSLVNELVARGFGGVLTNPGKEQEFMEHINKKLNRNDESGQESDNVGE